MNELLIDVHDDAFSASSSDAGSQPFSARMLDLSIFARNGFSSGVKNAKLTQAGSTKNGAFQSGPYGTEFPNLASNFFKEYFQMHGSL